MENNRNKVVIKDEDIIKLRWMNLSGNQDPYTKKTDKTFTVVLTESKARELEAQGFNIRWREFDDGNKEASLRVFARYGDYPPQIYQVSDGGKNITLLDEDTVGYLDNAEIDHADIELSPYHWTVNGNSGVKAYIRTAYFAIAEDQFRSRYTRFDD